jgi:hypothetical protein
MVEFPAKRLFGGHDCWPFAASTSVWEQKFPDFWQARNDRRLRGHKGPLFASPRTAQHAIARKVGECARRDIAFGALRSFVRTFYGVGGCGLTQGS